MIRSGHDGPPLNRRLGAFETAQVLTDECSPFNVVVALSLENGPAWEPLRDALACLQAIHPGLRARILSDRNGYFFAPMETLTLPFQVQRRTGADAWQRVVEEELNARVDRQAGPLFRCRCLVDADGGGERVADVILTFFHAIADAPSGARFLHRLLSLATADQAAAPDAGRAGRVSPAAEELFPPSLRGVGGAFRRLAYLSRQMADEIRFLAATRGERPRIHAQARSRILPRTLPEGLTRAAIGFGRSHGVTLNAILSIAQLQAVQQLLHEGRVMPYRLFVFPDLRPHLVPPASDDDLASYFSMLRLTFVPRRGEGFRDAVVRFQNQVSRSLRRGERFTANLLSKSMMSWMIRRPSRRMGHSALSYTGPATLARAYGHATLQGMHAFVSNLGLGPEWCCQARLFAGRIHLDFIYLDTDHDEQRATALAERMQAILEKAVSSVPGAEHEAGH